MTAFMHQIICRLHIGQVLRLWRWENKNYHVMKWERFQHYCSLCEENPPVIDVNVSKCATIKPHCISLAGHLLETNRIRMFPRAFSHIRGLYLGNHMHIIWPLTQRIFRIFALDAKVYLTNCSYAVGTCICVREQNLQWIRHYTQSVTYSENLTKPILFCLREQRNQIYHLQRNLLANLMGIQLKAAFKNKKWLLNLPHCRHQLNRHLLANKNVVMKVFHVGHMRHSKNQPLFVL